MAEMRGDIPPHLYNMQFFYGIASLGVQMAQAGGVAFFAHIGGSILGFIGGFVLRRPDIRLERI